MGSMGRIAGKQAGPGISVKKHSTHVCLGLNTEIKVGGETIKINSLTMDPQITDAIKRMKEGDKMPPVFKRFFTEEKWNELERNGLVAKSKVSELVGIFSGKNTVTPKTGNITSGLAPPSKLKHRNKISAELFTQPPGAKANAQKSSNSLVSLETTVKSTESPSPNKSILHSEGNVTVALNHLNKLTEVLKTAENASASVAKTGIPPAPPIPPTINVSQFQLKPNSNKVNNFANLIEKGAHKMTTKIAHTISTKSADPGLIPINELQTSAPAPAPAPAPKSNNYIELDTPSEKTNDGYMRIMTDNTSSGTFRKKVLNAALKKTNTNLGKVKQDLPDLSKEQINEMREKIVVPSELSNYTNIIKEGTTRPEVLKQILAGNNPKGNLEALTKLKDAGVDLRILTSADEIKVRMGIIDPTHKYISNSGYLNINSGKQDLYLDIGNDSSHLKNQNKNNKNNKYLTINSSRPISPPPLPPRNKKLTLETTLSTNKKNTGLSGETNTNADERPINNITTKESSNNISAPALAPATAPAPATATAPAPAPAPAPATAPATAPTPATTTAPSKKSKRFAIAEHPILKGIQSNLTRLIAKKERVSRRHKKTLQKEKDAKKFSIVRDILGFHGIGDTIFAKYAGFFKSRNITSAELEAKMKEIENDLEKEKQNIIAKKQNQITQYEQNRVKLINKALEKVKMREKAITKRQSKKNYNLSKSYLDEITSITKAKTNNTKKTNNGIQLQISELPKISEPKTKPNTITDIQLSKTSAPSNTSLSLQILEPPKISEPNTKPNTKPNTITNIQLSKTSAPSNTSLSLQILEPPKISEIQKTQNIYKEQKIKEYYNLLGLSGTNKPTKNNIKTAFRKLALQYHPDKYNAQSNAIKNKYEKNNFTKRFQNITEAKNQLLLNKN